MDSSLGNEFDDRKITLDSECEAELLCRIAVSKNGQAKLLALEEVMAMLHEPKPRIDVPPGWEVVGEQASALEAEFHRELPASHELAGQSVRVIAVAINSDDVLLDLVNQPGKVAVVHLTWSRHPEQIPWPSTKTFASLDEWRRSIESSDV